LIINILYSNKFYQRREAVINFINLINAAKRPSTKDQPYQRREAAINLINLINAAKRL
jgi:hypothetical protein